MSRDDVIAELVRIRDEESNNEAKRAIECAIEYISIDEIYSWRKINEWSIEGRGEKITGWKYIRPF